MNFEEDQILNHLDRLWKVADARDAQSDRADARQTQTQATGSVSDHDRIGKYRLVRLLGMGAFGVVYQAHDEDLGRDVALKLPRLEVLLDKEKLTRFSQEAVVAAQLDHPGIVRVYEAQLNDPKPYIASALCLGPTLSQWLEENSARDKNWREIVLIMAEVADAAAYAHRQGVFHRDIKPANILLEPRRPSTDAEHVAVEGFESQWMPKLTDFGLAKIVDMRSTETRSSLILGTPAYMAPEHLLRDGSQSSSEDAADIYSLGAVLYEALASQPPIPGSDYIETLDNIRKRTSIDLCQHRPDLPASLAKVCRICLQKNPEARYSSAGQLANDLRHVVAGEPITGKPARLSERVAFWSTRPQRINDAGWFTVIWQSILAVWMLLSLAVAPLLGAEAFPHKGYYSLMVVGLIVFSFGPLLYCGWLTVKKVRWGLYGGLVLSCIKLPLFVRAVFYEGLYFEELFQDNALLKVAFHLLFVICILIQTVLYVSAFLADRKYDVCRGTELTR